MKVSHVSSYWMSQSLRNRMLDAQAELNRATHEVSTGKLFDSGLTLGGRSSNLVSTSSKAEQLDAIAKTNKLASNRLDIIQNNLQLIDSFASDLLGTLSTGIASGADPSITVEAANNALQRTTDLLNTAYEGVYVFAGYNSSVPPMSDYQGGAAQTAFANAFTTHFGFSQSDPLAQNIDAAAITTFMSTVAAPLFTGPAWQTNLSSATDQGIETRIAEGQTVITSASANETGIRNVVMATVIAAELFGSNLNSSTRDAVAHFAIETIGTGVGEVGNMQGRLGLTQQRIKESTDQVELQRDILTQHAGEMESVDPFEASTRASFLLSQVELSYSITARINGLSLMRFI